MDHQKISQILGNYGQFVGTVAIVATLVYLVIQTQQNTAAILSSGRQASLQAELDNFYQWVERPELYPARNFPEIDEGLDNETRVRRRIMFLAMTNMRQNDWFQYRNGVIDQDTWDVRLTTTVGQIEADSYTSRDWEWISASPALNPAFVQVVNDARTRRAQNQ